MGYYNAYSYVHGVIQICRRLPTSEIQDDIRQALTN